MIEKAERALRFLFSQGMSTLAALVGHGHFTKLQSLTPPVSTVEDFLSRDTVRTANELRMSIQEFESLKLHVTKCFLKLPTLTDQSVSAWKLLASFVPAPTAESYGIRPTGIKEVDAMFSGGFPASSLISVVGGTGSGKTHIVAACATSCALLGMKVLVISCTNDITIKRLQTGMEASIRQNQNPRNPLSVLQTQEILVFALSNLYIQHCYDLWSLLDLLSNIRDHNQYDVILIDSLHHLISPLLTTAAGSTSTTANALSRATSTYNASSGGNSSVAAVTPAAASEYLNALLAQMGLLLRSLTSQHSTVIVTNTPAVGTGLLQKGALNRTSSASANTSTYSYGAGAASAVNSDFLVTGTGMQNALLDMVDVIIALERGEYDRSNSMRDLLSSASANAGAGGPAATPTAIKAGTAAPCDNTSKVIHACTICPRIIKMRSCNSTVSFLPFPCSGGAEARLSQGCSSQLRLSYHFLTY